MSPNKSTIHSEPASRSKVCAWQALKDISMSSGEDTITSHPHSCPSPIIKKGQLNIVVKNRHGLVVLRCCSEECRKAFGDSSLQNEVARSTKVSSRDGVINMAKMERVKDSADRTMPLRVWRRQASSSIRVKCGCCNEAVVIYFHNDPSDDLLEINGVVGTVDQWKQVLLPLLGLENQ